MLDCSHNKLSSLNLNGLFEVLHIENTSIELKKLPKNIKEIHFSSHKNKHFEEQKSQIEISLKKN
ncbi:MAG: hypothetical protein MRERV_14c020 [Mycoplasmataceae bacterium RV_VA103A]|nr:MAG: hypothetical protein MRERV_14c020 [Mycoplasmataceae bacterium RV_VA103A]